MQIQRLGGGRIVSPFSFSLTSYLKFIQENRQKNTTAAKITRWESFLAGTRVLRFSCSCSPPPLLPHPQLVALSSREAFASLVSLEQRPAQGNLSVMCGSCPAGTGPRRSPGCGSTALGGLPAPTPPLAQLTRGPWRCRGVRGGGSSCSCLGFARAINFALILNSACSKLCSILGFFFPDKSQCLLRILFFWKQRCY